MAFEVFGQNFTIDEYAVVDAANDVADELFADAHIDRFENDELFDTFRYEFLEDAIEDAIQDALDSIDLPKLYKKRAVELKAWAKEA